MRELLFRGKSVHTNEWVYGYFYEDKMPYGTHATIISTEDVENDWDDKEQVHHQLDRKTVSQFTGLTDKNGKEIYEGDIIKHKDPKGYSSEKWEAIFYSGSFWLAGLPRKIRIYNIGQRQNECEVIGNIHDNPDLLKIVK